MTTSLLSILSLSRKLSKHNTGVHKCLLLSRASELWKMGPLIPQNQSDPGALCAPPSLIPSCSSQISGTAPLIDPMRLRWFGQTLKKTSCFWWKPVTAKLIFGFKHINFLPPLIRTGRHLIVDVRRGDVGNCVSGSSTPAEETAFRHQL